MTLDPLVTAEPVAHLIEQFNRLPGIGPKSAQRLTFFLLRAPADQAKALAEAIAQVRERIGFCSVCYNLTEADPCAVCTSPTRDRSKILVVEEPLDVLAIERTHEYKGLYHVLNGTLSPMDGIGPDDLRIKELETRLDQGGVQEVILATNPNLEGEATAMHLFKRLSSRPDLKVTGLARGLPIGGDLEYADDITLTRALQNRRAF